ncbi:MAG: hypothetical protein IKT27_01610 [Clostridia bacterium]|nr:hypothetical protein [Clostridia bacterium]
MKITKFFKTGITNIIVLAIAVLLLLTIGFNMGPDFNGGSVISVNCQSYTQLEAENKIRKVVQKYDNATIYSVQYGELYGDDMVTVKIKFTENADKTTEEIVEALYSNSAFGYDKDDIVESKFITATANVGGAFTNVVLTEALLASLVSLLAISIYMIFRQGFANAVSLIAGVILDLAMFMSVLAICRFEITAYVGIATLVVTLVSAILHLVMLTNLSKNAYDEDNRKLNNKDVANLTFENSKKSVFVLASVLAVAFLLIAVVTPAGISGMMFAVVLTIALALITTLFITPSLWAIAFARKRKQPKKTQIEVEEE